jgi:hypothetical protein
LYNVSCNLCHFGNQLAENGYYFVAQYSKKAPPLQSFLFNLPLSITFGFDWRGEFGSFYPISEKVVLSILFNYVDSPKDSYYYSQRMLRPAGRISYYILRNAKTFFEVNGDAFNGWAKII